MSALMLHILRKGEAKRLGMSRYFSGIPCINGHISERRVSGGACIACCKDYREANIDRIRAKMQEWSNRNKDYKKAYNAAYLEQNRQRLTERCREYRRDNLESLREYDRTRYAADPDKRRKTVANWREQNRDRDRYNAKMRKKHVLKATPAFDRELTEFVVAEAVHLTRLRHKDTGIRWAIDHMIPLRAEHACGLHHYTNIQVIPWDVNAAKNNSMELLRPAEWVQFL